MPDAIKGFARKKGYPFAPLARLLDADVPRLSERDPMVEKIRERPEKSLLRMETECERAGKDLVLRLKAAQDRVGAARLQAEPEAILDRVFR